MRSVITGPVIVSGNLNPQQLSDTDVGPSVNYQGVGLLDPRQVATIDAAPGTPVYAFYNSETVSLVDQIINASAAANIATIAAAQTVPAGGTGTLTTFTAPSASAAISPNVPVVPFGQARNSANVVTVPVTLDFGFLPGGVTTTAGSANITVASAINTKFFFKGQWVCIPGAGATTALPLIAQVTGVGVTSATTINLSVAAGQSIAGTAACGSLDLNGVAAWPYAKAGAVALYDPTTVSRGIRIVNNNAADTGYSITVRGYDLYGTPMTETIAVTANGTSWGKKAWKHLVSYQLSKTGGGTTAGTITVGTSDVIGIPLRADFFEYLSVYYAGAFVATNGGSNPLWVGADLTNPQTASNGDPRGTVQIGANGGGSSSATSPNGTNRFALFMSVPAYNAVNASNINYATLTGYTQNAS